MHRALPIGNKICYKRNVERNQELHREKIRHMRSTTDTKEPEVCKLDHIRNNLKREQMLEERYSEIDRENRILLQKMADIMRNPSCSAPRPQQAKGPVSLNKDHRRAELIRITHENQAILKRIQKAQPVYNHIEWKKAHKRNSGYMKNACEYPVVLKQRDINPPGARTTGARMGEASDKNLDAGPGSDRGQSPTNEMNESTRYVLKEGKKISGNYYLIEMATDGRTLTIAAYDGDSQKTLELLVNEKNHRRLYRECNRDYSQIAARLSVEGDKLQLVGLGVGDSDRHLGADDMIKEGKKNARASQEKPGSSSSVKVDLEVGSDGKTDVKLRGITPTTPSVHSGYQ